ncbi:hypothetical protein BH10BDE1_BH10BDE1_20300 [soil metagenome]
MFITTFKKSILMVAVAVCGVSGVLRSEAATACASVPVVIVEPAYALGSLTTGTLFPPVTFRSTDPVGPFPLSALVPFPWTTIEGIWTMKMPDGTPLYFSFEVASACDGRKVVKVTGFDQQSYRVTAEGVGIGLANDTMVRAVMTSATSQYMVFIRQFKLPAPKSVTTAATRAPGKISTVITVRPFSGDETDDVHMIARKASTLTLTEYLQKQHEDEQRRQDEVRRRMSAGRP